MVPLHRAQHPAAGILQRQWQLDEGIMCEERTELIGVHLEELPKERMSPLVLMKPRTKQRSFRVHDIPEGDLRRPTLWPLQVAFYYRRGYISQVYNQLVYGRIWYHIDHSYPFILLPRKHVTEILRVQAFDQVEMYPPH